MAIEPLGSMMSVQAQSQVQTKPAAQTAKNAAEYTDVSARGAAVQADNAVSIVENTQAGQYAYHREVKNLGSGVTLETDCKAQVLGALTYALTKRKVDVEICSDMLQALFAEAEEIAVRANENVYMTGSTLQEGEEKILWDMILVSAIDYVITNNEYATMIEEHLHYLAGENETAECLVTWSENGAGDRTEENSVVRLAGYVMMLSEILSHRQEN